MFIIREQFMDHIDNTINIDTYKTNTYQYVLKLMIEIIIDYIVSERKSNPGYDMGRLELEYRCPIHFLNIEDDTLARAWIRENKHLNDKGLIGHILDNTHRMSFGKHKFMLTALKTFYNYSV